MINNSLKKSFIKHSSNTPYSIKTIKYKNYDKKENIIVNNFEEIKKIYNYLFI